MPICLQRSGAAETWDPSGRWHSVRHFLGIDELSVGFTLTPMAARRVIVRHIGCDDKLFQEEDALARGHASSDHEDKVIQIVPAEAFEIVVFDDVGGDTAPLLLLDFQPAFHAHCFTVAGVTFSRLAMADTV